ncbi:MAG: hypothetical protein WC688_02630 [Parachlamydiales bacterium]|jgi:hypothetical protein
MSVIFNKISIYNPNEFCSICLEPLNKTEFLFWKEEVVAHDGDGGDKHPFHKVCLDPWVNKHRFCPMCWKPVHIVERQLVHIVECKSLWVNALKITVLVLLIIGLVIILDHVQKIIILVGTVALGVMWKCRKEINKINRELEILSIFESQLRN